MSPGIRLEKRLLLRGDSPLEISVLSLLPPARMLSSHDRL